MRSGTRKIGLRLRDEALLNTSSGNFLQSERTSTMHQKERRTRKSQLRELTGFRLLFGDPRRYHREPRSRSSCPAPTKSPEEQPDPHDRGGHQIPGLAQSWALASPGKEIACGDEHA